MPKEIIIEGGRRPGVATLANEIAAKNPTWPRHRVQAEAKLKWFKLYGPSKTPGGNRNG